ncbi:MAG: tyrosine-type recombinase/integrase, partial [Proteobacteria bacterium]|nr:tyrosine-type recombinase/integrase [Pseudomonadota bacterium]
VDVGEAIADYILNGRAGRSRSLFVTLRAPHPPLRTTHVIRRMLVDAFAKAAVPSPKGGVRTHLLRHALAVDMLNRGNSLNEIGDVLRHRSRTATTIYARHGIETLRALARSWPIQGDPR